MASVETANNIHASERVAVLENDSKWLRWGIKFGISMVGALLVAYVAGMLFLGFQMLDMNEKLDTVKVDVSMLQIDVSKLQTDVSMLQTDVSKLQADVSNLQTDMGKVKAKLNIE